MSDVWMIATPSMLIVRQVNGRRRTLQVLQIEDLAELDDTTTEVIYRNGARIVVRVPFDALYPEWRSRVEAMEWEPR